MGREYIRDMKDKYNPEDMWPEDLSDAIASGDIRRLEEAWENGWNVNMPLKKIYLESLGKSMKRAEEFYEEMKDYNPFGLPPQERRVLKKEDLFEQTVFAEIVYPVTWGIQHNCLASVEWLIQHGAVLDVKDYPSGENVDNFNLHAALAAINVSMEMLRLVVKHGAKIRDRQFDFFLLNSGSGEHKKEILTFLLEHGADIEAAMMGVLNAAYHGDTEALELFFSAGFDINCHTGKGENFSRDTVLGYAATYGTPDMVRYLLTRGADPTIRNAKGMTPYDLALQNHQLENAALLRNLCDPDGEGRRQAQEKLPQDIIDYLKDGERRLTLGRDDIAYIDFLALDDVALLRLARRKCILLSKEVENFSTLWIVWNPTRKTVAYYDYENEWYGEFKVSFTGFLAEIDKYLTGIFHGDYEL